MRRRLLAGFGLGALASTLPLFAQQAKAARVGILSARSRSTPSNPDPNFDAFARAMRELGYVEGKNVAYEWRFAEGRDERLPELAADLVRLKPDLLVSHSTPGHLALKAANSTIPHVMVSGNDPVASGIVKSLARPDGNITGVTLLAVDLSEKSIELLKIILPRASRVGVVVNPQNPSHVPILKNIQAAAQARGMQVVTFQASNLAEIERGLEEMKKRGIPVAVFLNESIYLELRRQIADSALKARIASIFYNREAVDVGGLMSYGTSVPKVYRRAATYVDKILKGAKPADLPIEQPSTFELVVNVKTANAIGLKVPQELYGRADVVIE
jgi:putative ABC transport system substrate-binding protein